MEHGMRVWSPVKQVGCSVVCVLFLYPVGAPRLNGDSQKVQCHFGWAGWELSRDVVQTCCFSGRCQVEWFLTVPEHRVPLRLGARLQCRVVPSNFWPPGARWNGASRSAQCHFELGRFVVSAWTCCSWSHARLRAEQSHLGPVLGRDSGVVSV